MIKLGIPRDALVQYNVHFRQSFSDIDEKISDNGAFYQLISRFIGSSGSELDEGNHPIAGQTSFQRQVLNFLRACGLTDQIERIYMNKIKSATIETGKMLQRNGMAYRLFKQIKSSIK